MTSLCAAASAWFPLMPRNVAIEMASEPYHDDAEAEGKTQRADILRKDRLQYGADSGVLWRMPGDNAPLPHQRNWRDVRTIHLRGKLPPQLSKPFVHSRDLKKR